MGRTVRRGNDRETEFSVFFAENLIAEMRKLEVKFDKPIYVGMCILDISKVCLYEFHHEYMSDVSRQMQDHIHRHGQSHLPYKMRRCLQEYETRYR